MKDRETNKVRAKVIDNTSGETLHPFISECGCRCNDLYR